MLALTPDRAEKISKITQDDLMQIAGRSVQDRLPVDQLPLLIIRPCIGEGEIFLHRHRTGLDRRDAHGARS